MSVNKTLIIVLSSFVAAGIVCLAAGLVVYFWATGLPASADGRGAKVLAGVVVTAVGGMNTAVSLAALAVVLLKNLLSRKSKHNSEHK